jgi:hypothetical protein
MNATPWITYRTRFLVNAKQLTTRLTFTDVLGRQHSGRKGDYLVESSDGVLRIAPRQIFEDIYVPLLAAEAPESSGASPEREFAPSHDAPRSRTDVTFSLPVRKAPQPDRNLRHSAQHLRSLYD